MKSNDELKQKAVELRRSGKSYRAIVKELGVPKSTLSYWIKDVELHPDQIAKLKDNQRQVEAKRQRQAKVGMARRHGYQELGLGKVNKNDWEHAAGCMLWWGEGTKRKHQLTFTNCEAKMISFFCEWLRKYYGVESKDIRVWVQCYEDSDIGKIKNFWLSLIGLDECSWKKPYCKKGNSKRTAKHEYGVCSVRVLRGTKLVNEIWGAIQGYLGFSNPDFLK